MHKFYLIFALFFLSGCSFEGELKVSQKDTINENKDTTNENKYFQIKRPLNNSLKLEVVIVDGCEYLYGYVGGNGGYVLCHRAIAIILFMLIIKKLQVNERLLTKASKTTLLS